MPMKVILLSLAFLLMGPADALAQNEDYESCCLPDTTCANMLPDDCIGLGGVPQGPGTVCAEGAFTRACCFPDGSCLDLDSLCCLEMGGQTNNWGQCGGDNNNNGINDACEPYWGACCLQDGSCELLYEQECQNAEGEYQGDYIYCLGDNDLDGTDDRCQDPWLPGDDHKMHFPQLPEDVGGIVTGFMDPLPEETLADDFMCIESGPISGIHLWVGFRGGVGPFHDAVIQILSDIPAHLSPTGYSMPGDTLWEYWLPYLQYTETIMPATDLIWYDPFHGIYEVMPMSEMVQYDIHIPDSLWFVQDSGTVYWLSISSLHPVGFEWGWLSTTDHWNDDAVWNFPPETPSWEELYEPPDFVESLDFAFVITGPAQPTEACCFPSGCWNMPSEDCINVGGTPQGPGTYCEAAQACCLPDGSCTYIDPTCCIDELGGSPQGPGTTCSQPQGCCLPDGECVMLDPLCCAEIGGAPMGPDSYCSQALAACCFADTCLTIDSMCCMMMGGMIPPEFPWFCLGDNDASGFDDACEVPLKGACCWPDGGCTYTTQSECVTIDGAVYKGDGSLCQGDNNDNGVDDICDPPWLPGDDHKMHQPQLPDYAGWDVFTFHNFPLADDWICSQTGWIKDFHFWGSWRDDIIDDIRAFNITVYHGDMMPEYPLWTYWAENFVVTPMPNEIQEGWLEPWSGMFLPDNHYSMVQYDVYLPQQNWLWQDSGATYWLSIVPETEYGFGQWGWKSSTEQLNNPAMWTDMPMPPPGHPWNALAAPPSFEGFLDLSFVVTGGLDCDCIPGNGNFDPQANIGDAVYLIAFIFKGGPPPGPYQICSGDANCDCQVNVGDAVYLISWIFKGGPPPCTCEEWIGICGELR